MTITFYRTALCPRCFLAKRALDKIVADTDITVETVEVATTAVSSWRNGIRMIPALKIGDEILSGVLLDEQRIRRFIDQQKEDASA
ncbi:thioredoxin family protein [Desulfuromonas acetoxidans]|uniref:glutaredoxin family protein n=1 Tax=Desulfuromonas acetoxidans TaxID=891 RepID=UPI00292FB5C0|nr:thioredoxin family protein [Desulfuromonas acetoxidans]